MPLRQRFLIDHRVQGILVERAVVYFVISVLYILLGSTCFQYFEHPEWSFGEHASELFRQFWPWIPTSLLVIPLVLHDIIRLSNLFAGPIYRLRMHLDGLIADPNRAPLRFREDDYWQDLVKPINALQEEIVALRSALDAARKLGSRPPESSRSAEMSTDSSEATLAATHPGQQVAQSTTAPEADRQTLASTIINLSLKQQYQEIDSHV